MNDPFTAFLNYVKGFGVTSFFNTIVRNFAHLFQYKYSANYRTVFQNLKFAGSNLIQIACKVSASPFLFFFNFLYQRNP